MCPNSKTPKQPSSSAVAMGGSDVRLLLKHKIKHSSEFYSYAVLFRQLNLIETQGPNFKSNPF